MRTYLLPEKGDFYKANLHCHSTLSDGNRTPEELKAGYKAHGYSVLAITDHECPFDHSGLSEDGFLLLNGYEAYVKETQEPGTGRFMKTAHLNFIAKAPSGNRIVRLDPAYIKYAHRTMPLEDLPRIGPMVKRYYTVGEINRLIQAGNDNGFLVFYNHPAWSREVPQTALQYRGLLGMEVFNYSVYNYEGYPGDDTQFYDQFLRAGQRVFAFANDDNHNKAPEDDPLSDSYGGFNMIKAERLDYASIIAALEKGDFYCSQGPVIDQLYIEDNALHITFPQARDVFMVTEPRGAARGRVTHAAAKPGEKLTEAVFQIMADDGFIRLEVVDFTGKKAYTRGYFLEDLGL